MTFAELSAQAAALERDHNYAEAGKLWQQAAESANEKQINFAQNRADFCATVIRREWQ